MMPIGNRIGIQGIPYRSQLSFQATGISIGKRSLPSAIGRSK